LLRSSRAEDRRWLCAVDASFPPIASASFWRCRGQGDRSEIDAFVRSSTSFLSRSLSGHRENEINAKAATRLARRETTSSDQLFYVIYTSGTTGKPRACNRARGHLQLREGAGEVYGIGEGDRCYQAMTLGSIPRRGPWFR